MPESGRALRRSSAFGFVSSKILKFGLCNFVNNFFNSLSIDLGQCEAHPQCVSLAPPREPLKLSLLHSIVFHIALSNKKNQFSESFEAGQPLNITLLYSIW